MEWRFDAARDPATPQGMLLALVEYPDCRTLLSENKSTPAEVLERLSQEDAFQHLDPTNRRMAVANVLRHRNTPGTSIAHILEWTEGHLNKLQDDENPMHAPSRLATYFYPSAAGNPNTPKKYLVKFEEMDDELTTIYLVENPSLPQTIIDKYAELLINSAGEDGVRLFDKVAQNPNLKLKHIEALSKHAKDFVRDHISRNPTTPALVLMEMIKDEYFMVRIGCLMNLNLPLEGIEYFATQTRNELRQLDHNWIDDYLQTVRRSVLRNPNSTEKLRTWVASEEWLKTR
jgi:hypothetical protein